MRLMPAKLFIEAGNDMAFTGAPGALSEKEGKHGDTHH